MLPETVALPVRLTRVLGCLAGLAALAPSAWAEDAPSAPGQEAAPSAETPATTVDPVPPTPAPEQAPSGSPAVAAQESPPASQDPGATPAAVAHAPAGTLTPSLLYVEAPRVTIGGFADVTVESKENLERTNVTVGQLVVHGNVVLPSNFGVFTEVSVNSNPVWETRVERLLLTWEPGDSLKISVGRQHLPVTWWNSTFHHGLWLQTSARRPMMIGYSDAFIPNHSVGVMADGLVPGTRAIGLRYHLGLSGGGDDHKHAGEGSLENPRAAYSGALAVEPRALRNLRVGAVAYLDPHRVRDDLIVSETLIGAHVAYTSETPELIGELVHVLHDAEGTRYLSQGAYVQVGWRLAALGGRFKPYARGERMRIDAADPTLEGTASQDLFTAGLRIDPIPWLAIKVEGAYRVPVEGDPSAEAVAQVGASW